MNKPKSGFVNEENMCLFKDYYEDTMGRADLEQKNNSTITENYFVRKIPQGEYLITAGLEQVMHFVENLHFPDDILDWFSETSGKDLSEEYIDYLRDFRFEGDVSAIPEGTPVFPNEPIINITGPSIDVQLIETYILNVMNFQTLIATKASRVKNAAKSGEAFFEPKEEKSCLDFGARRAHGRDAAVLGARASYAGGMDGTSLELAGYLFGIPYSGTMAHKFIQDRQEEGKSFQETELKAFREYAEIFPEKTILLIDTYNTIKGAENACIVGKELEEKGCRLKGIRLDSGNLLDLSKKVRNILDSQNLDYVKIVASSDLDEFLIEKMLNNGAPIDGFGIGTRLITGANYNPLTKEGGVSALPGVYKLCEKLDGDKTIASMKLSDDKAKTTLPGKKQVYRVQSSENYVKDIIALEGEKLEENCEALLVPIMKKGKPVYDFPEMQEIRANALEKLEKLPEKYKKLNGSEKYPVELSRGLKNTIDELSGK